MSNKIYIVERGIMMNGWEWIYDNEAYFSTLEKAKNYIKNSYHFLPDEDDEEDDEPLVPVFEQINDNYVRCEIDFESRYGILTEELDKQEEENG